MSKLFDSRLADVIRKPVITEKATNALDLNQYTFEVDHRAAKPQIKAAIEALFSVKVEAVPCLLFASCLRTALWIKSAEEVSLATAKSRETLPDFLPSHLRVSSVVMIFHLLFCLQYYLA